VFVFEDQNIATHLVRNALGGAKREQVSVLLSIPSPLSRRYRDDVSIFRSIARVVFAHSLSNRR
jgi:pyruvate dehydrogenase phosphatase